MESEWVQLGVIDGPAANGSTSFLDNKLGGVPDWPPSTDPQFNNKCDLCSLPKLLVFQCYAPLENSPYHRTLYIYACINPNCWNKPESWSCIRIQCKDVESVSIIQNVEENFTKPSSDLWCNDANDWDEENDMGLEIASGFGSESNTQTTPNLIDESMEEISHNFENMSCANVNSRLSELKLKMNNYTDVSAEIEIEDCPDVIIETPTCPVTNIPKIFNEKPNMPNINETNNQFECMYVKVYPEDLNEDTCDHHVNDLLMKYKQSDKDLNLDKANEKTKIKTKKDVFLDEEYEKGKPLHGDLFFHSFLLRIKRNPEQIVRYSLGGQPLLISEFQVPDSMKCIKCFSEMQFELQILPTLIPFLRIFGSKETHLEFGNIIIYTCKNSCWKSNDRFVKETIIVQCEAN